MARFSRHEVLIEGDAQGLQTLLVWLETGGSGGEFEFSVPDAVPAPYEGFLVACAKSAAPDESLLLCHDGVMLRLRGGVQVFSKFVKYFRSAIGLLLRENSPDESTHFHVSYYEDHPFLNAESDELIVELL